MRIAYIIPGPAGPFFEKNSQREQALVAELRWNGHDVLFVPVLFPLKSGPRNAPSADEVPLFGSAVRVYLNHIAPTFFSRMPGWFWRMLDTPAMRSFAARRVMGSRKRLADFLKDALDGRNGALLADMEDLCHWIRSQQNPDVVLLSTPFLLGLAPALRNALRTPIACAMNSELEDLAMLDGPEAIVLLTKLRSAIPSADGFITESHFHSDRVQKRLGVPAGSVRHVHPGLQASTFEARPPAPSPCIGIVVRGDPTRCSISVDAAKTAIRRRIGTDVPMRIVCESNPFQPRRDAPRRPPEAETPPRSEEAQQALLGSFSVLVFLHPDPPPAFDFHVLEAQACGTPTVLPDTGANREIAGLSDATLLYDDADALAAAVAAIVTASPTRQAVLRELARKSVEHCFSMPRLAQETAEALQAIVTRNTRPQEPWPARQEVAPPPRSP
ncbi:MAG: glycosyltransferase [Kiritimatiellia bacterium]|jgi:hypothetical protein